MPRAGALLAARDDDSTSTPGRPGENASAPTHGPPLPTQMQAPCLPCGCRRLDVASILAWGSSRTLGASGEPRVRYGYDIHALRMGSGRIRGVGVTPDGTVT
jgi:hypothetical protein